MRHQFQSTSKPISHRNGWSFRVYMISLRDNEILAPVQQRGELTLGWYHVSKYRAMKGNRSDLAPARKSPRCHVNTL